MKKKIVAGMCALACACLVVHLVYSDNFYIASREDALKEVNKYINDKNHKITPQHLLIQSILDNNIDGVKKALENGANVNFQQDNKKPLFFLVKRDEQDLNIDSSEGEGENLEQEEIRIEQQEFQEEELTDEQKAESFFIDLEEGITPLGIAVEYSALEIIEYLLKNGANPNKSDNHGMTPLMVVINMRDEEGSSTVISIINLLLKFGANVNARNYYGNPGYTALYYVMGKSDALSELKEYDALAIMDALIKGGANVNMKYPDNDTLLHLIINQKEVEKLLQSGAHPNERADILGDTPLMSKVRSLEDDDTTLIDVLLKYKADPNIADDFDSTPLMEAIDKKFVNVIESLLEGGANPQLLDEEYRNKLNQLRLPKRTEGE